MPESDPLIGRMIAHYRVVERLGGGMGVVYKAEDQTGYRGSIDHSAQCQILGLNHQQFRAHFDMLRDDCEVRGSSIRSVSVTEKLMSSS